MKGNRVFGLFIFLVAAFGLQAHAAEFEKSDKATQTGTSVLSLECKHFDNYSYAWDYTDYDDREAYLYLVESAHFTQEVEALISGVSNPDVFADLDYTLRRFPNHHRALSAAARFEFQVEDAAVWLENFVPIDCYFQNAVQYKPSDGIIRLIYATYLHRKGVVEKRKELLEQAKMQYNSALELMPESAEVHYNVGLFYFDIDKLNLALSHAHKAYNLGYPLPGLKDRLIKRGVWSKTVSQN